MTDPYAMFNSALDAQFKKNYDGVATVSIEIGQINDDLSLKVDRFETAIPKAEYYLSYRLSLAYEPKTRVNTTLNDGHTHSVDIPLTKGIAQIKPGDKVLVAWENDTPIIIDKIVSGEDIEEA